LGGCSLSVPMVNSAAVAGVDREPTGSIKKVSATEHASPLSHNLDIED